MGQAAEDNEQMEQLRELIKVLLGVSALKDDVADIESDLFKLLHQLEVRCPQLSCHFHVSGVSRTTGDTFFVVVYDAAVLACDQAKRVLKTMYTHLHSQESMVMTSALFRNSLVRLSRPPHAHLLVQAAPVPENDKEDSTLGPSLTSGHPQAPLHVDDGAGAAVAGAVPTAPDGGAPPRSADDQPPSAAPPSAGGSKPPHKTSQLYHGHLVRDWVPPGAEGEVDAEAEEWDEDGNLIPSVASAPPSPTATDGMAAGALITAGVGFSPPPVHAPSTDANDAVEDLFTAVKGGWVGILRATLAAVLLALVAFRGLQSKAGLQGMLVWWPLVKSSRNLTAEVGMSTSRRGRRGRAGDRLLPQPYPVEVQRRHLPTGERRRDVGNVEEVVHITLAEVSPAGVPVIADVVATLLLLYDKERSIVAAVIDKKLAEHGVTRKEKKSPIAADALASLTIAEVLARGGIGGAPLGDASTPTSVPQSDASAATSQQGIGQAPGINAAVATRLAARRAAGLASQRAQAAHQQAEAAKKAQRSATRTMKRSSGAAADATPKKRLRGAAALASRSEALASEFHEPDLKPAEEVQSCAVLVEADMLKDHTYHSLATNWPPLETDAHQPAIDVKVASSDEWGSVVDTQKDVMAVLEEATVRHARRELMAKADELRGGNDVELDEQTCRVYVHVAARGTADAINLTASTLQAMSDFHTASLRVQVFRAAVEWLRVAAGYTSARVPDFSGAGRASNGVLATEVVAAVEFCHPTATVWRLTSADAVGAEQDVIIPAYLLVKNAQDVCMTDDIISVNTIILARWCVVNRPDFWVLHCSFFMELLSENEDGIAAMAVTVHAAAAGATRLMGVCNIKNVHWIALGVNVNTAEKVVTIYDSGAHFQDLQKDVTAAGKKMQLFGKCLRDLIIENEEADEAKHAILVAEAPKAAVATRPDQYVKSASTLLAVKEGANNVEGGGSRKAAGADKSTAAATSAEGAHVADGTYMVKEADVSKDGTVAKVADVAKVSEVDKGDDMTKGGELANDAKEAAAAKSAGDSKGADVGKGEYVAKGAEGAKGAGDSSSIAAVKPARAAKRPKPWSTRRIKVPAQTDNTSCGPFAFSFLWHQAHAVGSKVLACDAFALRMSMVAAVVRDGRKQDEQAVVFESAARAIEHNKSHKT